MIVEFLGLPGSGKTTLCDALRELMVERGLNVRTPPPLRAGASALAARMLDRGRLVSAQILRDPSASRRLVETVWRSGQPGPLAFLRITQAALHQQRVHATTDGDHEWLLLDQGFAQFAFSLAYDARSDGKQTVESLLSAVALADVHVFVEAAAPTLLRRLDSRPIGGSRLERDVRDDPSRLARCTELLGLAVDDIERRGGVLLRLGNDEGLDPRVGGLQILDHMDSLASDLGRR